MASAQRGSSWGIRGEPAKKAKPLVRFDGELYERPEPNPFSQEWLYGYDAGFDDRGFSRFEGTALQRHRYNDGYAMGLLDREVVDRDNSSNT